MGHRTSINDAPNESQQDALEDQLNKALLQSCGQPCVQVWSGIAQASNSSNGPAEWSDRLASLAEMAEQQLRSSQQMRNGEEAQSLTDLQGEIPSTQKGPMPGSTDTACSSEANCKMKS